MTAVAPPPNVHSVPRSWNGQNLDSMTSELFIPRGGKPHRYPMPQSASTGSLDTHGGNIGNGNWVSSLGGKKKGTSRAATVGGVLVNGNGMVGWPKSDANHVRTNGSISSQSPGPNGIHQPGPILPSQHLMGNGQMQQNGHPQTVYLMLISLNGTFDRKQIPLPYYPEILRIGRQTNAKTTPTPINGYFDSKVLSRQHAEVWADKVTNKVWIRDVKSSNGTFVNGQRLSPENQESEAHELHSEDVLELGIDIVGEDNKTIVHHKVAARVEHAGVHVGNFDMNFGDIDPMVNGSMMPAHGSNPNLRMRTGSQSSRGGTMQNGNGPAGPAHRQQQIMMAPVSMEMVVKKLNVCRPGFHSHDRH
ncbi:SMAD/FHA domain-containing protein [Sphaerosporella brunnea]|uniref:SMAD/FHA domain-containing protein n=1 Tax=Sphaerosporella brunnea TaxID=1250544 RepID=A0A5J5FAW9_9PEZI|nr:SMAD/FHA domain-containing protein [Sphaerosporella brunnea]